MECCWHNSPFDSTGKKPDPKWKENKKKLFSLRSDTRVWTCGKTSLSMKWLQLYDGASRVQCADYITIIAVVIEQRDSQLNLEIISRIISKKSFLELFLEFEFSQGGFAHLAHSQLANRKKAISSSQLILKCSHANGSSPRYHKYSGTSCHMGNQTNHL